ncbi:hypothetical protein [Kocuria kalidii]|uniref:hypothetical protein n=1 Tax=Kocuria kalidii TaxID=3376283 RepID=UPI00379D5F89
MLTIEDNPTAMALAIETTFGPAGCLGYEVVAVALGRREYRLHDVPAFGTPPGATGVA